MVKHWLILISWSHKKTITLLIVIFYLLLYLQKLWEYSKHHSPHFNTFDWCVYALCSMSLTLVKSDKNFKNRFWKKKWIANFVWRQLFWHSRTKYNKNKLWNAIKKIKNNYLNIINSINACSVKKRGSKEGVHVHVSMCPCASLWWSLTHVLGLVSIKKEVQHFVHLLVFALGDDTKAYFDLLFFVFLFLLKSLEFRSIASSFKKKL